MNTAGVIFTIIGTSIAGLSAIAGLMWWAYKRGQAAGKQRAEDKAKIEALERQVAELTAQPSKRRWI